MIVNVLAKVAPRAKLDAARRVIGSPRQGAGSRQAELWHGTGALAGPAPTDAPNSKGYG